MKATLPILLLLLSAGLFFGYIDGAYKGIQSLQAQKTTYEDALESAKLANKEFITKQNRYESIPAEEVEQVKRFLPDNIDNIRLVIELNNIALRHGMALKSIKVDTSKDTAPLSDSQAIETSVGVVSVGFTVTGTYETFMAFLKDMEKSMRIADIVNLTASAPAEGKVVSDYNVTVKTYWLK